jgi:hypothetical protein
MKRTQQLADDELGKDSSLRESAIEEEIDDYWNHVSPFFTSAKP